MDSLHEACEDAEEYLNRIEKFLVKNQIEIALALAALLSAPGKVAVVATAIGRSVITRRLGSETAKRIDEAVAAQKPAEPPPPKPQTVKVRELTIKQRESLKKFEKKLPSGARATKIIKKPDGKIVLQADVPAKNIPGSYARYEKTIDAAGKTVGYTKTTYGPNGEIIHIKDKLEIGR